MSRARFNIRDLFAYPGGRETARAFVIFGLLLMTLVGIIGELGIRGLSLDVLRKKRLLGYQAATEIAREVARLGAEGGDLLDFARLRLNEEQVKRLIQAHISRIQFIRFVEIRDRFDVRVAFVVREGLDVGEGSPPSDQRSGPAWPDQAQKVINVPLSPRSIGSAPTGGGSGQVLLGISHKDLERELVDLRRSLWFKIVLAGALAIGVLVVGLFYVLYLIRKNRNLEQARQSASRASYVGLLASGLAHEIRNPLNAMNMNLQMLEEELTGKSDTIGSEETELLDSTKSEIKRLERLVGNFLAYARPAPARLELKDLNVMVRQVVKLLTADFLQSHVTLTADLEPLLPQVEVDDTQLKQALINLMVNARQVLKEGGEVIVRTRAGSTGDVVIEVADDGPGIPAEARERIFEVFYSSRGGGTGLGLSIARQIVERHDGRIELDSIVGEGTTFRIRLPRHHKGVSAAAETAEETAS